MRNAHIQIAVKDIEASVAMVVDTSELAKDWYDAHGRGLRAGEETHSRLKPMIKEIGDPVADRFSVDVFTDYRTRRIDTVLTALNMNREHA